MQDDLSAFDKSVFSFFSGKKIISFTHMFLLLVFSKARDKYEVLKSLPQLTVALQAFVQPIA